MVTGIYMIKNLINDKKYIGKAKSIYKRFGDHKRIANYKDLPYYNYPLYRAFRKYGIENFEFSIVEECEVDELEEREKYWISYYEAFGPKGYNQTPGGDGCPKVQYKKAVELYNNGKTIAEIADYFDVTEHTIIEILHHYGLAYMSQEEKNKLRNPREVQQFDLDGNYLNTFYSAGEAARQLKVKNNSPGSILEACNIHTTAYKYLWKYTDDNIDMKELAIKLKNRESIRLDHVSKATLKRCSKPVNQYDLDGKYLQSFPSASEAGRQMENKTGVHISEVCRGIWKTAYGYKWRYTSSKYPEGVDLNNGNN